MKTLRDKAALYLWGGRELLRLGKPERSMGFLGGIGDDLLCTAPINEWLRRGSSRLWFFTRHPALYRYDQRVRLIPEDARYQHLATRLNRPMRSLSYSTYDPVSDQDPPPQEHIIARMCRHAGLKGTVSLRPHLVLDATEMKQAAPFAGCIAIQGAGMHAGIPMLNKQWPANRMQEIVTHFGSQAKFVQIGSSHDPVLEGAHDLRGRTTLRETAAVLAQARLFVGLVGFPMHLARAVDCPSVIIYGGRETAAITGYSCNINLEQRPSCAPCWQRNRCNYDRICLEAIETNEVIRAIETVWARPNNPLSVETQTL